jgi:hypothetical protein
LPGVAGLCLLLLASLGFAESVALNKEHPDRYTVVEGDTLWDIASRFLRDPWQWRTIWRDNTYIRNPGLIYPGDVIALTGTADQPRLEVETPSELRLSPEIRVSPLDAAIPSIPLKAIRQFLTRPQVLSIDQLNAAPYVVSIADEHIVAGAGNRIFVRGLGTDAEILDEYAVVRSGMPLKSDETGELLGHEAIYIGTARFDQKGPDASAFAVTSSEQELRIGDRLVPIQPDQVKIHYQPHAPNFPIRASILNVVGGVSQIGQYSVLTLDKGTADGLETGHVLEIWQQGQPVRDMISVHRGELANVPDQRAGVLMVFRPFERVSYGLVMKANRFVHVRDFVQTP